jgi:hypothetical protein
VSVARRRADAERLHRAREFAALIGVPVERWMRWSGWVLLVGCDVCGDEGRGAACWGRTACHGWENGCGCIGCAVRQARELEQLRRRPAATLVGRLAAHAHHKAREAT